MGDRDEKLKEISRALNEHIMAVKGTLDLMEASVSEADLQGLLTKAIERMDAIQKLSQEVVLGLRTCFEKMDEIQNKNKQQEQ
ncbi:MAG: hypothetical protein A2169_07690 [Deltaproteobacteria bacterium RBG_13_47_9]|nr:MAG: hypothetical protein A2169_07690 [Deltaproteobacteria bacterium RBG_13_47_9]